MEEAEVTFPEEEGLGDLREVRVPAVNCSALQAVQ